MFNFGKRKYDKFYKLVAQKTQSVCDIISKDYYDKAFKERRMQSLFCIFIHLCHFVKNYYQKEYNFKKSEHACTYMIYQFHLRVPDIDVEILMEYSSAIITTLAAFQRMHDDGQVVEGMEENIYLDIAKSLVKNVCFYDTYFFKYDELMIKDIAMELISLENQILAFS